MIQCTGPLKDGKYRREFAEIAFLERAAQKGNLVRRSFLKRADQGQSGFARSQVVAGVFPHGSMVTDVIEHVIDELERGTQRHAIPRQSVFELGSGVP